MITLIEKQTKTTLVVALFFSTLWGYTWVQDSLERDPLSIEGQSEAVQVQAGDLFNFNRDVCSTKDLNVSVHREFHNLESGKKYMLPSIRYVAYAKDGCYKTQFATPVPLQITPGIYEYRPILIYNVNSRKTVTKPAPFVSVEVIE